MKRWMAGHHRKTKVLLAVVALLAAGVWWGKGPALIGAAGPTPVSLKNVPVPKPANLARFVADEAAAVRLGKALFWDMQLGSDGTVACASCHFHAGTDNRVKNTLAAGPDGKFDIAGPNGTVDLSDFPFHRTVDRHSRGTGGTNLNDPAVAASRDDVIGAQGVNKTSFHGVEAGKATESGRVGRSGDFFHNGRNVRQVTGRNTPTVINAVFNFANFWDGRANQNFNGVNSFGVQDVNARVWVNAGGALAPLNLVDPNEPENQLNMASLASQAVGPPPNAVEMSWDGRQWRDIGRKMLTLTPLGKQLVHPDDSVLGLLSKARTAPEATGLATTYPAMIQAAFQPEFWNGNGTVDGFTQMEVNFSLFFGLAVQMYESTLVSDNSPFDQFAEGDLTALSEVGGGNALRGLSLFLSGGLGCANCHVGPEFTAASVSNALNLPVEPGLIETMNMGDGTPATYDIGFYNIGVTPTSADVGRGGNDPFGNPLAFSRQRQIVNGNLSGLTFSSTFVPAQGCVPDLLAEPPLICPPDLTAITRVAANGSFKTPTLRNVELTGPYFHNGGAATLMQVVDFYIRGGNFHEANIADLDPFIQDINGLKGASAGREDDRRALVDFLLSLTDERVAKEMAPFDHPQLFIADGHDSRIKGNPKRTRVLADRMRELKAVGAAGREAEGITPLKPYLADNLAGSDLENFHYRP